MGRATARPKIWPVGQATKSCKAWDDFFRTPNYPESNQNVRFSSKLGHLPLKGLSDRYPVLFSTGMLQKYCKDEKDVRNGMVMRI